MSLQLTAPAAIVLAAGQGTRMRSRIPKVLHSLAGRSLLDHVLDALAQAGIERTVVVTGHGAEAVEASIGGRAGCVRQEPQRGTADAVRIGLGAVPSDADTLLVTMGDAPMQPPRLYRALIDARKAGAGPLVLVAARVDDPSGYGRIVRAPDGSVVGIVEEQEADESVRSIDEINVGTYAFDVAWLRKAIERVKPSRSVR